MLDSGSTRISDWSGERVQNTHASRLVMCLVTGHNCQIVTQRRRCDLLVQRILRVRYTQATPDVREFLVESEDRIRIVIHDSLQPTLEKLRLRLVTSVTDDFDTLPKLADRDDGQMECDGLTCGVFEEFPNARVCLVSFASLADDVCVYQVHDQPRRSV
jgi:hypothetical protein